MEAAEFLIVRDPCLVGSPGGGSDAQGLQFVQLVRQASILKTGVGVGWMSASGARV